MSKFEVRHKCKGYSSPLAFGFMLQTPKSRKQDLMGKDGMDEAKVPGGPMTVCVCLCEYLCSLT